MTEMFGDVTPDRGLATAGHADEGDRRRHLTWMRVERGSAITSPFGRTKIASTPKG